MSTQLWHPLGPWTPTAAETQKWHAPTIQQQKRFPGILLVRHHPPSTFQLENTTWSHLYYWQSYSQLPPPNTNFPVTIEPQKHGFRIAQPLYPIPINPPPATVPLSPTCITKIQHFLPEYAPELWSQFAHHPNTNKTTLFKHIQQNKGQLIIVSDASLNTQHCSAFSWTIATATTELWTGAGTSPSTQRDAHSGHPKAMDSFPPSHS